MMCAAIRTLLLALLLALAGAYPAPAHAEHPTPALDRQEPFRLICWEAGPHADHQLILQGLAEGLKELGLIKTGSVPEPLDNSTAPLWQWLADNATGRVAFLEDGFYSADWNEALRKEVRERIATRAQTSRDFDLVLAFDTWTAVDAAAMDPDFPVLVSSVTTFANTRLEQSLGKGTNRRVCVVHERDRLYRLATLFHSLFGFEKLGVVLDNGHNGHDMAGLDELQKAAKDRGFALVPCAKSLWGEEADVLERHLLACNKRLVSEGVDAVVLTLAPEPASHWDAANALSPLAQAGIPTFSLAGGREIKAGALLGTGRRMQLALGRCLARVVANMIKGIHPPQDLVHVSPLALSLNMQSALALGWDPPLRVLAITDEYVDMDGEWRENGLLP